MPKQTPAPNPLVLLVDSMVEHIPGVLSGSVTEKAIKFKDLALSYLTEILLHVSELSDNQIMFVRALLLGFLFLATVLYFVFVSYMLR